jgi:hypothetical protein
MAKDNKVRQTIEAIIYHIWKYSFLLLPIPLGFLLDPVSSDLANTIFLKLEVTGYTEIVHTIVSMLLLFCMIFLTLALWNILWDRMAVVSKVFTGMFFALVFFLGLEALGMILFQSEEDLSVISQFTHSSGLGYVYTFVFLLLLILLSLWLEWGDTRSEMEEEEYLRDMIRSEVEATLAGQAMGNVFEKKDEKM